MTRTDNYSKLVRELNALIDSIDAKETNESDAIVLVKYIMRNNPYVPCSSPQTPPVPYNTPKAWMTAKITDIVSSSKIFDIVNLLRDPEFCHTEFICGIGMAILIPKDETPPLYKDRYEMYFRQPFYIDHNYYWVYSNWKLPDTNKKRALFEHWLRIFLTTDITYPTTTQPTTEIKTQEKIGKFVKRTFKEIIENINRIELDNLQRKDYSKTTFHIQHPFLKKVAFENQKSPLRYWTDQVSILGGSYFICSEWYEVSLNNDRPYYEEWLNKIKKISG